MDSVVRAGGRAVLLDAVDLQMLAQVVVGATHEVVARRLRTSLRTVECRTARVRDVLGASTRYTLGAYAIRGRLVQSDTVISYAQQRADAAVAVPTDRQRAVLRLLATGASDERVAATIGTSPSTVRRDLNRLATANGASARVTAGALFEALGWH